MPPPFPLTPASFAAAHYSDEGLTEVADGVITGLVFGTIFGPTSRILFLMTYRE